MAVAVGGGGAAVVLPDGGAGVAAVRAGGVVAVGLCEPPVATDEASSPSAETRESP